MEKAKEMKTIRLVEPFYANHLGNGMFAGKTYVFVCKKCGLTIEKSNSIPPMGRCTDTRTGTNHSWVRTEY